jgi:hypothetical protein
VCWRDGERGSGAGEHDDSGVLRRLRAETHRTVLREVRPRLRGDCRSAASQLSFGNSNSAACRFFGDRRSAAGRLFFDSRSAAVRLSCDRRSGAGSRRSAAGRLFFDSRSAAGSLAYVTSALALYAGWNARKRARGIYVGQEYHRLARGGRASRVTRNTPCVSVEFLVGSTSGLYNNNYSGQPGHK